MSCVTTRVLTFRSVPQIPGGATLVFEIELLEIVAAAGSGGS